MVKIMIRIAGVLLAIVAVATVVQMARQARAAAVVEQAWQTPAPPVRDLGTTTSQMLALRQASVNFIRGTLDTYISVWPQLWSADLRTSAARLEVPVYFLEGRHDINASPYLAEEYYHVLDAPHKELIWFEHSGHSLWINEHARFVEVLVQTVLAKTQPAR